MAAASVPTILAADSGLGGLTVVAEIRRLLPTARLAYLCDNAFFPYGKRPDAELLDHFLGVMERAVRQVRPDLIVTACNTISTICLPELRAATTIPVVGVVPAIKPAAQQSKRKIIGLLATAATVDRPYTDDLIKRHAADCAVLKVGSAELVEMAEAKLLGRAIDQSRLPAILAPFFDRPQDQQPDVVVLGCTHFPLLRTELEAAGPAGVAWIDSGIAVARRVLEVLPPVSRNPGGPDVAFATRSNVAFATGRIDEALRRAVTSFGFPDLAPLTANAA
jgi:glutamate racemase